MATVELVEEVVDVEKLISNFKYHPYPGRVVVKEIEIKETCGGIEIPETSKDSEMKTNEGYVIAVGDGIDFCKQRDRILYGLYSGAWFIIDGIKYRVMNEKDIIALKENPDAICS